MVGGATLLVVSSCFLSGQFNNSLQNIEYYNDGAAQADSEQISSSSRPDDIIILSFMSWGYYYYLYRKHTSSI